MLLCINESNGTQAGASLLERATVGLAGMRGDRITVANMVEPSDLLLQPELPSRDGRVIRSVADAIALIREHESRPGVDARDEVLHRLERARTDQERQEAVQAFFAWAKELDLIVPASESAQRRA